MRKLLFIAVLFWLALLVGYVPCAESATVRVGAVCTKMDGSFNTVHTMTGCTIDAAAEVCVVMVSAYGGAMVSSVTVGGAAASIIGSEVTNSNGRVVSAYQRVAPATGSQNTVITFSASVAGAIIVQTCWDDYSSTSGFQSFATGVMDDAASPTDLPAVSCQANGMVIDMIHYTQTQTIASGMGQTQDANLDETLFGPNRAAQSHKDGAASVTMSWTFPTMLDYATLGFCLNPGGGGGGGGGTGIRTGSGLLLGIGK